MNYDEIGYERYQTNMVFPLTQNQTSIWLDDAISEDKAVYIIGGCAEFKCDLDINAFQQALQKAIAETDAVVCVRQRVIQERRLVDSANRYL